MPGSQKSPVEAESVRRPTKTRSNRSVAARTGEIAAVQSERQRVAQLLHDTVCQELTGICFLASAGATHPLIQDPETRRKLEEIADLIHHAGARLTEIVHSLRTPGNP